MNRYIFLFLIAAFSLLLHAKCVAQKNIVYGAGITYTVGIPTFVPTGNSSRVAIDTGTMKWYEYAQVGGWRWSGDRVQDISGCAAPAYVPGKAQSRLVLNACTEAQNGHGPELYKYTGSAWLCLNCGGNYTAGTGIDITGTEITNTAPDQVVSITGAGINAVTGTYPNFTVTGTEVDGSTTNELQTLSSGTNTVTLSNSGGTVTVDTDPANDITSLSGGTGISISGSGNSRTITNTGDLSATNELQTLSISNDTLSISDGNSVVLPGGGVTWPLLAPNGTALSPSYSFENDTLSGMYLGTKGLTIQGSVINVKAFAADDGGSFLMSSGEGLANAGGEFRLSAGNSSVSDGGQFNLNAGNSDVANGGQFSMAAGNGASGGNFTMNAGSGTGGGGTFSMSAGDASDTGSEAGGFVQRAGNGDYGGTCEISAGVGITQGGNLILSSGSGLAGGGITVSAGISSGESSNGGNFEMYAGANYGTNGTGGSFSLIAGSGDNAGSFSVIAGNGLNNYGEILIEGGNGPEENVRGVVKINNTLRIIPITVITRNNITPVQGDTVFCSNCTANDSSTGVLQTYNGTTWKNHW